MALGEPGSGRQPPYDRPSAAPEVALAPDGRFLVAWRGGGPVGAATGTLGGEFGGAQRLGSPVRDVGRVAPVWLADGRAAVAWTDNESVYGDFPRRHGRLHLAVEGGEPQPSPAAPRLALRAPRRVRLFASHRVPVTARCDRPCDVRATAGTRGQVIADTATLLRAGSARLHVYGGPTRERREKRVTIRVRASAPGGREVVRAERVVRVRTRPALPVPVPLDLRARRRGDAIVVSWRTARPVRRGHYFVAPGRRRFEHGQGVWPARGQTRFSVRLRPPRPEAVRVVTVRGFSLDRPSQPRQVRVPVTG